MIRTFHRKRTNYLLTGLTNEPAQGITVGFGKTFVSYSIRNTTSVEEAGTQSIAFPHGRILKTSAGYETNYHIADHLGSIRTIVKLNAAKNGVQIIEQNDYYPFGQKHKNANLAASTTNRFLYNGKEKQTTGNLSFLDYGARMYDPTIARWNTTDPLMEKYYSFSPYNYCIGNPAKLIDPDGEKIIIGNPVNRLLAFFGVNNFEKKMKQHLQTLKSLSVQLNQVITELEESEHIIYIKHSKYGPDKQENSFAAIRKKDPEGNKLPAGGTVYYDPDDFKRADETYRPPIIGLVHELGHASNNINATYTEYDKKKIEEKDPEHLELRNKNEKKSIDLENIVRKILNIEQRSDEYYKIKK